MATIHAKMGTTLELDPLVPLPPPAAVGEGEVAEPERKRLKKIDFRYTTYASFLNR